MRIQGLSRGLWLGVNDIGAARSGSKGLIGGRLDQGELGMLRQVDIDFLKRAEDAGPASALLVAGTRVKRDHFPDAVFYFISGVLRLREKAAEGADDFF